MFNVEKGIEKKIILEETLIHQKAKSTSKEIKKLNFVLKIKFVEITFEKLAAASKIYRIYVIPIIVINS